jgi:Ca-activated chloride channel family protein
MEIAAGVLSNSTRSLPDEQQIGLVAYGHRNKGDCRDVEFLVHLDNTEKEQVVQSLDKIKPLGKTPLAYSALQVIDQLRATGSRATIILITDGIESCDGDLCAVIKAAREEGLDFRLHIVGFGLKTEETEALKCAADAGDGKYYDAADAGGLTDGLREATNSTVDDPTGNFTVYAVKNGQAVDAHVEAFKAGTSTSVATARTYADTALLYLPAGNYDLKVRPLENSDVEAVVVPDVQSVAEEITHRTVSFDGGTIKVSTFNNGEGWDAVVKIISDATKKTVSGGRTYGRTGEYELNPGLYTIEMIAMKINGSAATHRVEKVLVKAGEEVDVEHQFQS